MRMWLLTTAGFCCQPIQRRHLCLQGSKGRCHGNQILAKIGKNITKMATTSVVCNISMQSLVLTWDRVCAITEFICNKGQRGVTMATNFWTKIAINTYECISMRDNKNVITYNGVFVVTQCNEDISVCKGLRDVAMATKFWPKYAKYHEMAITSVVPNISMQSLVLT